MTKKNTINVLVLLENPLVKLLIPVAIAALLGYIGYQADKISKDITISLTDKDQSQQIINLQENQVKLQEEVVQLKMQEAKIGQAYIDIINRLDRIQNKLDSKG